MTGSFRATLIGGVAILLWALLALFTTGAAGLPPFQLLAMTFAVAFLLGLGLIARRGVSAFRVLCQPPAVWLLGVAGLFGYHAFYFFALDNAPAVEASLIAYLWPLLIVLFSALLPGERLRAAHVAGAAFGFGGAVLLIGRGGGFTVDPAFLHGYLAAFACALTWSGYSVLNRRFAAVPTDAVTGFCGGVALLGLACHLAFETTVTPTAWQGLAALALGLGPVGAAFFAWDHATKHGDLQVLGALAYAAPLISTLLLIAFGRAEPTWTVAIACLLITGGAALAARARVKARN